MGLIELNQNKKSKAIVVFPNVYHSEIKLSPEARLEEAEGLALAINLEIVHKEIVNLKQLKPATYFSSGLIERFLPIIEENEAELFIIDTTISPIQQRNLEKALKVKIIDRTALILEIFGERANTREGVLQVELAHLTYQRSRLVRSWTHLERQRGGAGFLGGPGETQIELDRRLIDDKIVKIKKELEKVKKTRELHRGSRRKVPYPVVALVGYTNAGKSSLFNALSKAGVFAEDLLFATLDPTMRKISLPSGREIILSDTVGFISDLPHELVMSFRATLEEVLEADVVVHVRDIANVDTAAQKKDVLSVLANLGLKEIESDVKYLEVLNKIDLLSDDKKTYYQNSTKILESNAATSAHSGEGLDLLLKKIDAKLSAKHQIVKLKLNVAEGKLMAWIYENAEVLSVENKKELMYLTVKISKLNLDKFNSKIAS
ncbi:MAG: GTPase HflX [Alphaproteobacteria bacterium]|nr:GTPase HflX [Alphaproteobacteria bacterium]